MSIPGNSPGRGCASNYEMPVTQPEIREAQNLVNTVHRINCVQRNPRLPQIIYRIGTDESDVTRHVVRWDTRHPDTIMDAGFRPRLRENTSESIYYDLFAFVQNSGQPLDEERNTRHVFISTTIDLGWRPDPSTRILPAGTSMQVYRYEIYAPGGILVAATLGDQHTFGSQLEVAFVDGIVPQYIRSAQLFTATRNVGQRHATIRRANDDLIVNAHFSPMFDPAMHLLISMPIHYFEDEDGTHRFLTHHTHTPPFRPRNRRPRRGVSNEVWEAAHKEKWEAAFKWYDTDVVNTSSYIDAAFRSNITNEAYIFMKNECVRLNYAPHSTGDSVLDGPRHICDRFPFLVGTIFQEYGIDCAFDTDDGGGTKAFIFCTNLCAYIDYAPRTRDDVAHPMVKLISKMFPFLRNSIFEGGIDAAFRSTMIGETYLFRGNQYAIINHRFHQLVYLQHISVGFPCLRGTVFESGIDAAFASHVSKEAYIFKGKDYALLKFFPHEHGHYLIDDEVKPILPNNWPSLRRILPHKNGGYDTHHYPQLRRGAHRHDEN